MSNSNISRGLICRLFSSKPATKAVDTKKLFQFKPKTVHKEDVQKGLVDFVDRRREYKKELSLLRSKLQKDIKDENEKLELIRKAERKRILQVKAINLRQKRSDALKRQEEDRKRKEIANIAYKEKLARGTIIRNNEKAEKIARYNQLLNDLLQEKPFWITKQTIESKIVPALFEKPSSTGLSSKYSEYWRWHVSSLDLQRIFSMNNDNENSNELLKRLEQRAQLKASTTMELEDFFNSMVSTGNEREKYKETISELSKLINEENLDPFELQDSAPNHPGVISMANDYEKWGSNFGANNTDENVEKENSKVSYQGKVRKEKKQLPLSYVNRKAAKK